MIFNELDTVILRRDIAKHGLRRGDIGTVVHLASMRRVRAKKGAPSGGKA